jgi:kumamolisin
LRVGDFKGTSYSVRELRRLYDFPETQDGTGQTVGIVELGGGYRDADLDTYFKSLGLPRPQILWVTADGTRNAPDAQTFGNDAQVELDVEIVGAIAPKARIVVYFASSSTGLGFVSAINAAVADRTNRPSVLVIGWGSPEHSEAWSTNSINAVDNALRDAALAGITVCAASGDVNQSASAKPNPEVVSFPASSPWVLAVGGTRLVSDGKTHRH